MRVLVTGGLGVNGVWVVRELIARGHDVTVVENRDDRSLLPDLADTVQVVACDVADAQRVASVVGAARPEVIVHMAAIVAASQDPLAAINVNVMGTAAICEAAASHGVRRVVYTSSRAAYGQLTGEHAHPLYKPVTEEHPRRPTALYDVTKLASEEIGRWYARYRGIEFVALRFATILGPGKTQRYGGFSAYSALIEQPARGESIRLERGGDERDDLVYVVDIAEAVVAAACVPGPLPHDAYNIGTGRTVSLQDLAEAVRAVLPAARIEIGPGLDPMGMGVSYYGALDSSRAEAELGWSPRFTLEEGVRHFLSALDQPLQGTQTPTKEDS